MASDPYSLASLEQLAEIIDHARSNNGEPTNVSHTRLYSDLERLYQGIFATEETPEHLEPTPWDMIAKETTPAPPKLGGLFWRM